MMTTISRFIFCKKTFDQVINNLQTDFRAFKVWFYDNILVLKPMSFYDSWKWKQPLQLFIPLTTVYWKNF